MFGIGGGELVLIAFVALLVFGPERIPELARRAAHAYRELLKLRQQVDHTIEEVKRDLRLDEELTAPPVVPRLRQPQDERAAASAATIAARTTATEEQDAPLPVPAEDDYLAMGPSQGEPS